MNIRPLVAGVALAAAVGGAGHGTRESVVEIPPGIDVTRSIEQVREGARIKLLAGRHEPFDVSRALTIEAEPGAEIEGPVRVSADGVRLVGLRIDGGENGIVIRDADGVQIDGVAVRSAELHGIEIAEGSARIRNCDVSSLGEWSQGIEIRNSNGRPRTVVENCTVAGAREGLVSHVSRVEFRNNVVTETRMAAIVVTEMSEGLAEGNRISNVAGVGLYCGDMSHCEFLRNVVRQVVPDPGGARNLAGFSAIAWYYSTMRLQENTLDAGEPPVALFIGSIITERFPLGLWPPGWRGGLPGFLVVSLSSIAGLVLVAVALLPAARRGRRSRRQMSDAGAAFVVAALGVQTFHMLEHGVQAFQVHVAQAENRSGLVGQHVDTEWAHLVFNAAVFVGLVALVAVVWGRVGSFSSSLLLAAFAIETYHLAEHVAKVTQHVSAGLNPAPGLFGARFGLVWFHFGINLAVYAGMAIAGAAALRTFFANRSEPAHKDERMDLALDAP